MKESRNLEIALSHNPKEFSVGDTVEWTLSEIEKYLKKLLFEPENKICLADRKILLSNLYTDDQDFAENSMKVIETYPDFFISPASAKYHGCYEGGLFDHSIAVLYAGMTMAKAHGLRIKTDLDYTAFVFHDLCKVGLYEPAIKNKKDENGKWVSYNGYDYNNDMPMIQHGPESLRRLFNCGVHLSEPWQLAVSYHMSTFDAGTDEKTKYSKMTELFPEVLLLAQADMLASKIYGL